MLETLFPGLDLHEVYSLLSDQILILIILMVALLLIMKFGFHLVFLRKLSGFFKLHQQTANRVVLGIIILGIIAFAGINYMIYDLDASTRVSLEGKIVVIEIDDYWNVNDEGEYFKTYGYSMENYRSVSDLLDKHDYVATLGVSPHIFIDGTQNTLDLQDDTEMVAYLKELNEKGYELAMHGYSHCRNVLYCPKYEEVYFNVMKGKRELEEMFGIEIITYLPPGNAWTTEQYENVKSAGFKMISNTHVPDSYFDEDVIITSRAYDIVNYWYWPGAEFGHSPYTEWIEEYNEKDFFTIQLHCNTFDSQEKLDDLEKFLDFLDSEGAKAVTYKEAYNLIIENK